MAALVVFISIIAFVVGVIFGCALPSFFQLWKISQYSYGKGFVNGKHVVGAQLRKLLALTTCNHIGGKAVCAKCADEVRLVVEDASRGLR